MAHVDKTLIYPMPMAQNFDRTLRSTHSDAVAALREFVDNAVDAGASELSVLAYGTGHSQADGNVVRVHARHARTRTLSAAGGLRRARVLLPFSGKAEAGGRRLRHGHDEHAPRAHAREDRSGAGRAPRG
jgi:hypothetical protein